MKTIIQIAITLVGLILGSWAGVFCIAFILAVLCAGEGAALGIICNDTPGSYITLLIVVVIFIICGGILGYKGGTRVGKWITRSREQGLGAAYEYPSPLTPPQPNHPGLKRYCSNCGTGLDPDGLFCQECGFPIEISPPSVQLTAPPSTATGLASDNPPHSTSHAPRKPGSLWPAIIVVVVAFLFFVFIGIITEEEIDDSFQGQPPQTSDARENHLGIERPIEITTPLPPTGTPEGLNHFEKGEQYLWLDENYVKAIESFTEYINLNPNYAKGYEKRGNSYQELKRYQEALQDYDKATELSPEASSDLYGKRGNIYGDLGQYQEAIKDYDKWLKLDPETLWPYHYKGRAYMQLEQYEVAIQHWETYVGLRLIESADWIESEQAANTYTNIGLAYVELDQYQEAIAHFDKALAIDQTYPGAISGKEKATKILR